MLFSISLKSLTRGHAPYAKIDSFLVKLLDQLSATSLLGHLDVKAKLAVGIGRFGMHFRLDFFDLRDFSAQLLINMDKSSKSINHSPDIQSLMNPYHQTSLHATAFLVGWRFQCEQLTRF